MRAISWLIVCCALVASALADDKCVLPEAMLDSWRLCEDDALPTIECYRPRVRGNRIDCDVPDTVLELSFHAATGPYGPAPKSLTCRGETIMDLDNEEKALKPQPAFLRCRVPRTCELSIYIPTDYYLFCGEMEMCLAPRQDKDIWTYDCDPGMKLMATFESGVNASFVPADDGLRCLTDSAGTRELRLANSPHVINWIKCTRTIDPRVQHAAMQSACRAEDQCIPSILQGLDVRCAPGLLMEARLADSNVSSWFAVRGARCTRDEAPLVEMWSAGRRNDSAPLINCRAPRGCAPAANFNDAGCGPERTCLPLTAELTCPPGTFQEMTYDAAAWHALADDGSVQAKCEGGRLFALFPPGGHSLDELPRAFRCNGPAVCTASVAQLQKGCAPADGCKPPLLRGPSIVCPPESFLETRAAPGKPWRAVDSVVCHNDKIVHALLAFGERVGSPGTLNCRTRSCTAGTYFNGSACAGSVCSPISAKYDCPAGATMQVAYTSNGGSVAWRNVNAGAYCRDQRLFLKAPPKGFTKADLPQYLRCVAKRRAGKP